MPDLIYAMPAPALAHAPALAQMRARPGRRRFLAGLGLTAAGVAATQWAPGWARGWDTDWRGSAPAHLSAPSAAPRTPAVAPPRPVQYGAADREEWAAFRHRFVTPEGRVIDTGNANQSHSEGQGWGLMGAQACDDPATFASLLAWTEHALQRRPYDCLHAWRYRPADAMPVSDLNNATDGDLFIAAALARAAVRWNRPDYAAKAARLANAVLGLVRQAGARTVLLPGAAGFEKPDAFIVNPSYYAFALFPDLAALAPSPAWDLLRQDGLALVLQGCFGRWGLPPDWLRVGRQDGALSIAPGWPPRFSYDAIRVPLHLTWARLPAAPMLEAFSRYWTSRQGGAPGWVDLTSNEMAPYAAPSGLQAVGAIATAAIGGRTATIPPVMMAADYYSAGLVLLSRLAVGEARSTS